MTQIPWQEFKKRELVEILRELESRGALLEALWSESDTFLAKDCSCEPMECRLPQAILEIRDRAAARLAAPSLGRRMLADFVLKKRRPA